MFHKRGHLVGNPDHARSGIFNIALLQAVLQNGGAGRIGNFKVIDDVLGAIREGVERQEVQASMRNDRDVSRSYTAGDWGKEVSMEFD